MFGHLRYVPPKYFWEGLLKRAVSLPVNGIERDVATTIRSCTGKGVAEYDQLQIVFWPAHPFGKPDLLLIFETGSGLRYAVFVEVKLDSGKSGVGDDDQLARCLRVIDSLELLRPRLESIAGAALIFLTRATSESDLTETLSVYGDSPAARGRLYRLDWQDVITTAQTGVGGGELTTNTILRDVVSFLRRRGLASADSFLSPLPLRGRGPPSQITGAGSERWPKPANHLRWRKLSNHVPKRRLRSPMGAGLSKKAGESFRYWDWRSTTPRGGLVLR